MSHLQRYWKVYVGNIENASIVSKDARYDPNDFLAFIASMEFVHDSDYDSDSDDEFIDDQKAKFLSNIVVEHEKLIRNYLNDHDILQTHKTKIDMFNVEKSNFLEKKIDFLSLNIIISLKRIRLNQEIKSNKPSSFVNKVFHPRTWVLNEILDKCKTHCDKRGLGYVNKDETPSSGENIFVKGKNITPN